MANKEVHLGGDPDPWSWGGVTETGGSGIVVQKGSEADVSPERIYAGEILRRTLPPVQGTDKAVVRAAVEAVRLLPEQGQSRRSEVPFVGTNHPRDPWTI